jgi:hypothetical protein
MEKALFITQGDGPGKHHLYLPVQPTNRARSAPRISPTCPAHASRPHAPPPARAPTIEPRAASSPTRLASAQSFYKMIECLSSAMLSHFTKWLRNLTHYSNEEWMSTVTNEEWLSTVAVKMVGNCSKRDA